MSSSGDAPWAALPDDLREQYATGDVIDGPSELIAEIERINNDLCVANGLKALADVGFWSDNRIATNSLSSLCHTARIRRHAVNPSSPHSLKQ